MTPETEKEYPRTWVTALAICLGGVLVIPIGMWFAMACRDKLPRAGLVLQPLDFVREEYRPSSKLLNPVWWDGVCDGMPR